MDTDVFSHLHLLRGLRSTDPRVTRWRALLTGRRVIISFQTRAEILQGATANSWGARRVSDVRDILGRTPTIRADDEVIDAYATLFAACRRAGHPLQGKQHTADRWIAACAIAKRVDLVTGDGIFDRTPGLSVLG